MNTSNQHQSPQPRNPTPQPRIPFAGTILCITAHWQDNLPDGLHVGVQFDPDNPTAGEQFSRSLKARLAWYDAHATAPGILVRLNALAGITKPDAETSATAICDIYWLEQRGHLHTDEYNGVMWGWTPAATRAYAMCEQNPVLLDMGALKAIDVTDIARTPGAHAALEAVAAYARSEPNPVTDWSYKTNRAQRRAQQGTK